MRRLISFIFCLTAIIFACAQNYKVMKIGGEPPFDIQSNKKINVGQKIDGLLSIRWSSKKSWLKVYDIRKRRITYFGPRGESTKGKKYVTGNNDLSARVKYIKKDSIKKDSVESRY